MAYLTPTNPAAKADAGADFRKPAAADDVTTFGRDLLITGDVVCAGLVTVFGRVIGDIHAVSLTIAEGGRVDGNVTVQDTVIRGAYKGTLHGGIVKLQGAAVVEGELHNNSLSIEENVLFEGVARRLERAVKAPGLDEIARMTGASKMPFVASDDLVLAPAQLVSQTSGIDEEVLA